MSEGYVIEDGSCTDIIASCHIEKIFKNENENNKCNNETMGTMKQQANINSSNNSNNSKQSCSHL